MNKNNRPPNPLLFWIGLICIAVNIILIIIFLVNCPGQSLLEVDGIFGPAFWGLVCMLFYSHEVAKYNESNKK